MIVKKETYCEKSIEYKKNGSDEKIQVREKETRGEICRQNHALRFLSVVVTIGPQLSPEFPCPKSDKTNIVSYAIPLTMQ